MARMKLRSQLALASVTCLLLSAWSSRRTLRTVVWSWDLFFWGIVSVASLFFSLLFLGTLWLRPPPYQGIKSVLLQLFFATRSHFRGKRTLRKIMMTWRDPKGSQERLLVEILARNKDTDYGMKYNFGGVKSVEEFKRRHPLITYDDYKPYVDREMAGERNVLTHDPPKDFIVTSGTTGPSKLFAIVDYAGLLDELVDCGYAILRELCPDLGLLQKRLFHYVIPPLSSTEGGGKIHPAVTLREDGTMRYCYTTPVRGFQIASFNEANYVHLLFALRERSLGVFGTVFVGVIDSMMKQLETWWEDIVHDIEHGTISQRVEISDDIRASLLRELGGGDPKRAQELRQEFEQGFDDIMKRVWPQLAVVVSIDNVGMWSSLKKKYAKNVSMVCWCYGCSEGICIGVAPWFGDDSQSLALCTTNTFFEFIKRENSEEKQPKTYLLHELQIDEEYEMVLTQRSGLYRYRMGDIIRVSGFQDNCPVFKFRYRLGLVLNLRYEKMDQVTLKAGIEASVARWPAVKLVQYVVAESTLINETCSAFEKNEIMPYYLAFLEMDTDSYPISISAQQKSMIDEELQTRNVYYKRCRNDGSISHPQIHFVKPGTFDKLKQHVLATSNTSPNQYKHPRKIHTLPILELILGQVSI